MAQESRRSVKGLRYYPQLRSHSTSRTSKIPSIFLLPILLASSFAAVKHSPPKRVQDDAGILDRAIRQQVSEIGNDLAKTAHADLLIVTARRLPNSASAYATELAAARAHHGSDPASILVVVLSVDDHKFGVDRGANLDPVLTHSVLNRIFHDASPWLQRGDYGQAVLLLAQELTATIEKRQTNPPAARLPPLISSTPKAFRLRFPSRLSIVFLFLALRQRWRVLIVDRKTSKSRALLELLFFFAGFILLTWILRAIAAADIAASAIILFASIALTPNLHLSKRTLVRGFIGITVIGALMVGLFIFFDYVGHHYYRRVGIPGFIFMLVFFAALVVLLEIWMSHGNSQGADKNELSPQKQNLRM